MSAPAPIPPADITYMPGTTSNPFGYVAPMPKHLRESYLNFFSARFACANAKAMAHYHESMMGFRALARREMEKDRNRGLCAEVVQNGKITLEFVAPVMPAHREEGLKISDEEYEDLESVSLFLQRHGEGVMDVVFEVKKCKELYDWAIAHGAHSVAEPALRTDVYGSVLAATIRTYGDVLHTLVERIDYSGCYLPWYKPVETVVPINSDLSHTVPFVKIDHCVGNQDWNQMEGVCKFYARALGFHQYFTDDDYNVTTEYSALETTVMASENEKIKMPITMPAIGKRMSQVEEFVRYNNGPGVQHLALLTEDIVAAVTEMRRRGVQFIEVSPQYYVDLRDRVRDYHGPPIMENLDDIEALNLLVDFNKDGYLLQTFVKDHISSRPTAFYEIIQRRGAQGFGGGNFRALFESIEREQARRGNLHPHSGPQSQYPEEEKEGENRGRRRERTAHAAKQD
ncbi:putative 4-hydroxyphenylpyruvate dioxygenase [Myxozyma melibiosi]|uniref:4-hydroxyphenylpyruvate dioxygenase n=1 Tax=Myxozyma melibiosi TaxID=54550 RepID=A0ABR1F250_9ASCO